LTAVHYKAITLRHVQR